jgi:hypothetical protein
MKTILFYTSIILYISGCSTPNSNSVVYESTSFEGCADAGGGLLGTKAGNTIKNVLGGASMVLCKNIDVYEEPKVLSSKKKN